MSDDVDSIFYDANQKFAVQTSDNVPKPLDETSADAIKKPNVNAPEQTPISDEPPQKVKAKGDVPDQLPFSDDQPHDAEKPQGNVREPTKVSKDPPINEEDGASVKIMFA